MPRPIDADAFKKFIIDHFPYRPSDGECMAYEDVLRMLSDEHATPTIEAERVMHGRWEEYWDDAYLTYFYRCSECKADAPSKRDTMLDQLLTPYCQHCGAKMDLN